VLLIEALFFCKHLQNAPAHNEKHNCKNLDYGKARNALFSAAPKRYQNVLSDKENSKRQSVILLEDLSFASI